MESRGSLKRGNAGVTIEFTIALPVAPAKVWTALTDPSTLAKWLAEGDIDPVPGGRVHLTWPGQGEMHGTVRSIAPPHQLSYSWIETKSSSEIAFHVVMLGPDESQLTLIHRGTTEEEAPGFGAGWHSHLESLLEVLSGGTTSSAIRDVRYEELLPLYTTQLAAS